MITKEPGARPLAEAGFGPLRGVRELNLSMSVKQNPPLLKSTRMVGVVVKKIIKKTVV